MAHFRYVMGGTVVFTLFASIYYWWPKLTGRFLSERLGKIHFWSMFVGFNMTFFVMHLLGLAGMPRRVAHYTPFENFKLWNMVASIGFVVLALSMVPFPISVVISLRQPRTAGANPWHAHTLEWATTSPPPEHNFEGLPPTRSERPVFDLRWIDDPDLGAIGTEHAWTARQAHDTRWFPLHLGVEGHDDPAPAEGGVERGDVTP